MLANEQEAKNIINFRLERATNKLSMKNEVLQCLFIYPTLADYILTKAKTIISDFELQTEVQEVKVKEQTSEKPKAKPKPKAKVVESEPEPYPQEFVLYDRFCIWANNRTGVPKLSVVQWKQAEAKNNLPDRLREHMYYWLYLQMHSDLKHKQVLKVMAEGYNNALIDKFLTTFGV